VIELTSRIFHISKVLYHWRSVPNSTASDPLVKPIANESARKALQSYVERLNLSAVVKEGNTFGRWRVQYALRDRTMVSIIIPTAGSGWLKSCVETIIQKSSYPHFEILIVDNSKSNEVKNWYTVVAQHRNQVKYFDQRHAPFNFSALNNEAVQIVASPLVLFLNDDTCPINADWLEAMIEHAQRLEVGAVGAQLLYANGTLQHAGVVMGVGGVASHALKNSSADPRAHIYFDLAQVVRNCSAVTGACLMTRRDLFLELGGFQQTHLAVAFQDVDLCLRLLEKNYRIIYTPHARLYHHESQTKMNQDKWPTSTEVQYFQQKWAQWVKDDPYYNPNLSRTREDFSCRLG
jgi:GT2 family glycosyltransferase